MLQSTEERARNGVNCPIAGRVIPALECFDAYDAVFVSPDWFAPEYIRNVDGWKDICKHCENNPERVED